MNIVFLGAPGSGKGTQAQRLAAAMNISHLSTGDVFRENIQGQTELGKEIKSYVDSGKLVPDSLVSEVVFDRLRRSKGGVLLDGYPRTLEQSKDFDGFANREKFSIDAVIFFDVPADKLVKRLSARRQCGSCKEVFNLETRKPKVADVCDKCGGALIHRGDDKPEVVQDRLKVYELQTAPILDYYRKRPGFHQINADQDIEKVFSDLQEALKSQSGASAKQ